MTHDDCVAEVLPNVKQMAISYRKHLQTDVPAIATLSYSSSKTSAWCFTRMVKVQFKFEVKQSCSCGDRSSVY